MLRFVNTDDLATRDLRAMDHEGAMDVEINFVLRVEPPSQYGHDQVHLSQSHRRDADMNGSEIRK